MSSGGVQPVPENMPSGGMGQWLIKIAQALNNVLQGKINATATVTLRAGQTTTTLTDSRIGDTSVILLMPTTAAAKTASVAGIYVTNRLQESCVLNHASNAATDQTFGVAIITG